MRLGIVGAISRGVCHDREDWSVIISHLTIVLINRTCVAITRKGLVSVGVMEPRANLIHCGNFVRVSDVIDHFIGVSVWVD